MLEMSEPFPRDVNGAVHLQRLIARVDMCARRARDIGRDALLRLHLTLPPVEPWRVWMAQADAREPFCAFHDGRSRLCVAAWGRLQQRFFAFESRFAAARAYCSQLLEQVVDVCWDADGRPDVDVPLALAGFAFANRGGDPMWDGWRGGAMVVPPVLVYRRGGAEGSCGAVINTHVPADADAAAIAERLKRQVTLLINRVTPMMETVKRVDMADSKALPGAPLQVRRLEDQVVWQERVRQAAQAAREGRLEKVVLARAADFSAPAGHIFDARATLLALRQEHPNSICFAMGNGDGSSFLGATPEILVHVSGRTLFTQAVAGTAPRGGTEAEDAAIGAALVASRKDRGEHKLVVDVLRETLTPSCVQLESPATPRLILLPRLQHLETPFVGTLRQAGGVLQWVESLHPTPSVGGCSRRAALAYLAEHEPLDRGWYAGPVGWLTAAGDGAFAVAIRSVLMRGQVARAYAGAGIVAASDPRAEWRETELKLRTVSEALRVRQVVAAAH